MQLVQEQYKDIRGRMQKNKSELHQVTELVKKLTNQQRHLKNRMDELKEVLETCNNNTINTFVSNIVFV